MAQMNKDPITQAIVRAAVKAATSEEAEREMNRFGWRFYHAVLNVSHKGKWGRFRPSVNPAKGLKKLGIDLHAIMEDWLGPDPRDVEAEILYLQRPV